MGWDSNMGNSSVNDYSGGAKGNVSGYAPGEERAYREAGLHGIGGGDDPFGWGFQRQERARERREERRAELGRRALIDETWEGMTPQQRRAGLRSGLFSDEYFTTRNARQAMVDIALNHPDKLAAMGAASQKYFSDPESYAPDRSVFGFGLVPNPRDWITEQFTGRNPREVPMDKVARMYQRGGFDALDSMDRGLSGGTLQVNEKGELEADPLGVAMSMAGPMFDFVLPGGVIKGIGEMSGGMAGKVLSSVTPGNLPDPALMTTYANPETMAGISADPLEMAKALPFAGPFVDIGDMAYTHSHLSGVPGGLDAAGRVPGGRAATGRGDGQATRPSRMSALLDMAMRDQEPWRRRGYHG